MPKLKEDVKKRIAAKIKSLEMTQDILAAELGIHPNTVSNAMRGESVNRNTANRLTAFANGEAISATTIELSPLAYEVFTVISRETGMEAGQWCSGLANWLNQQSPEFQRFIRDSVAHSIRAMVMPGLKVLGKDERPTSNPRVGEGREQRGKEAAASNR